MAISGGLAGDGSDFQRTWVLAGGPVRDGCVAAVGLYGTRLQVGSGCQGGWMDFGPERRITRSAGNVLFELDGKPALDLYKAYLGDLAQGLPGSALRFPLSIRHPGSSAPPLVRTILAIDEAHRSLTFAGELLNIDRESLAHAIGQDQRMMLIIFKKISLAIAERLRHSNAELHDLRES